MYCVDFLLYILKFFISSIVQNILIYNEDRIMFCIIMNIILQNVLLVWWGIFSYYCYLQFIQIKQKVQIAIVS